MVAVGSVVRLADELAAAQLRNDPFGASYMGVSGYDDAVPDLSPDARQAWRDVLVDVLIRSEDLEPGDAGSGVLLAAARDNVTRALALVDSRVQEFSVTTVPFGGPSKMLLAAARTSVTDAASAMAYLTRCRGIPAYLDQDAQRLADAVGSGLLPVAPLVSGLITLLRGHLAHPEGDPMLAHPPPEGWDGAATWRDELDRVIGDEIRPAIARYLDLLVELLPKARPPQRAGLLHVPGGTAAYACCIRIGTTLALDADEIHRIGLSALAEAEERIAETGARVLGARTAGQVMARLRDDASLSALAGSDAMALAAAAIARAEEKGADLFHPPLPPACTTEPMPPHMAGSGAPPMYSPPARDGSRSGAYLFNRAHPGPAGSWALESAAFHEGVPGHHAQFARLQLAPDLPLLLTAFSVVAHSEGWGLYAERLADEFGLYSDGVQQLGMLGCAAWRAVRLVVDSGLHARGWSRAKALEFALAHTPMPEPFMSAEIDRYIAMPGQALGYLIGQREIIRLRDEARARLGAAYDIRDFHSAVLDHGSLPLPVLSQVVQAWVTSGA
ncbi:MAG TPA: DUF885 domain-containing protein [Streptosporangiaceae bacterium]|nr:DUF885 domain-containing protein [Streptosporangiaceae bacterium]